MKKANLLKSRDAKLPVYGISYDSGAARIQIDSSIFSRFCDVLQSQLNPKQIILRPQGSRALGLRWN